MSTDFNPVHLALLGGVAALALSIREWLATVGAVFGRRDRPSDALQEMRERWRVVANRLGLTFDFDDAGVPSLSGAHGELEVRVTVARYDPALIPGGARTTDFEVTSVRISPELAVVRNGFTSSTTEAFRTGDELFDRSVALQGDELLLRGMCGADFRDALYRFVAEDEGTVQDHTLAGHWEGCGHSADWMVARLERAFRLARETSIEQEEAWRKVGESVRNEPNPDVRLELLRFVARHSSSRDVREIARGALRDPRAQIRMIAAELLGPEGLSVVLEVACDKSALMDARQAAVSWALEASPHGPVDVLFHLAETKVPQEAIGNIIRLPTEASLFVLTIDAGAADGWSSSSMLRLVAEASTEVRIAACGVLGRTGGLDELSALRDLLDSGSATRAVRFAMDQIRARATSDGAGQLSVTESSEDGAVSLTVDAGAVAIIDDTSE